MKQIPIPSRSPTDPLFYQLKKRRPNCAEVNTLSNKKCFVDRTVMIHSALHSPDLGEWFTYPESMHTTHRTFSTGFWSQSLRQKLTQNDKIFCSLTELQILEFQKSTRKSLFLQSKMFCWSHGHHSKYSAFPSSRRMFYILRTHVFDA